MTSKFIFIISLFINLTFSKFPDAIGYNGMVVSSNKYASQIGLDILKNGGNAIEIDSPNNSNENLRFARGGFNV